MNALEIASVVETNILADVPTYIQGAPGCGKTDVVSQVARKLNYELLPVHACVYDAVDLKGMPGIDTEEDGTKRTIWSVPDVMPRTGRPTVLFVDDMPAATTMTQTALFGLFFGKRIGPHQFPAETRIVAAGNKVGQRAGANRILTPLKSRVCTVDMEGEVKPWITWALGAGMPTELVAFHQFRDAIGEQLLNKFDPDADSFACSRAWENVGRVMKVGPAPAVEHATYSGLVGKGPAAELVGFLKIFRDLPTPAGVLLNPDNAPVFVDKPDVMFALCGALAKLASDANAPNFFRYANRLPDEFSVCLVKMASSLKPEILRNRAGIDWANKHQDAMV